MLSTGQNRHFFAKYFIEFPFEKESQYKKKFETQKFEFLQFDLSFRFQRN